jgi:ATP-binding cassette subfamily C protein
MKKYILAHPWLLVFAAVGGGIMQGLLIMETLLVARLVNALIRGDSGAFYRYIIPAAGIVVLLWLFLRIALRLFAIYADKSQRTLERDFFDSVLGTKVSEFNQGNSGTYISVLNNDIGAISGSYFSAVANFSKDALMVAMGIGAMVVISPLNAVLAVAMTFLPLIAPIVYGKRLALAQVEKSAASITFNQKVKDYLTGFEVIKTFGIEKNIRPRFFDVTNRLMRARYKAGTAAADVGALSVSVMVAATFINYFAAGFFALGGMISVGEVVAIVGLGAAILAPMTQLANHISSFKGARDIAKRVLDMMQRRDTRIRAEKISSINEGVSFNNVRFAYTDNNYAIRDFSYTFKKGGKYAVVGASGSGKSTLARLLMGYYDGYEGSILLSGAEMRDTERESLYRVITALPQNVFMLDDTLRNNITLFNHYSDEEYQTALRKANLTDVETALPKGSGSLLGEGGNTLSGGERQRVSIARALLKGSEMLVLDESSANLDNPTAHGIESTIMGMEGLTCVFVTHRYNADILKQCDGILVMKGGTLFESGTFGDLYAKKEYFYSLLNF